MKKNCVILHPLPRRSELEPAIDNDSRAWYWHQEVNGLWIRTALIAYIFNQDKVILKRKS
jgi:aspartate carbamoyltransferase catalytic subunit